MKMKQLILIYLFLLFYGVNSDCNNVNIHINNNKNIHNVNLTHLYQTSTVILKAFVSSVNQFISEHNKYHRRDVVLVNNVRQTVEILPLQVYRGTHLLRRLEKFNTQQYYIIDGQLNATLQLEPPSDATTRTTSDRECNDNNLQNLLPAELIVFGRLDNKNNLLVNANGLMQWNNDMENLIWNYLGWSSWSDYLPCSVSCGVGVQQRIRHCLKNIIRNVNKMKHYCEGYNIEQRNCNMFECTDVINLLLLHKDNHHSMDESFIGQVQREINKIETNFTIMFTFRTKQKTVDSLISFRSESDVHQSLSVKMVEEGLQLSIESSNLSEMMPIAANIHDGKWHQINLSVYQGGMIVVYVDCVWHNTFVLQKGSIELPKFPNIEIGNQFSTEIQQLTLLPQNREQQQCSKENVPILDLKNQAVTKYMEGLN